MSAQLDETTTSAASDPLAPTEPGDQGASTDAVLAEVLVEEISIDGMCGVY
jgi:mycofactocin precursor